MNNKHFNSIEALRGLAALAVALFHFTGAMHSPVLRSLGSLGHLGVDVFFVISGFVIPYSLWTRRSALRQFPRYMLRRAVRLEPPYLISVALVMALWAVSAILPGFQGAPPTFTFKQIALHLFYLIPFSNEAWLSPVYWSLAYEFAFYIIAGLTFSFLIARHVIFTIAFGAAIAAIKFLLWGTWDYRIATFLIGALAMRTVVGADGKSIWITLTIILTSVIWLMESAAPALLIFATTVIIVQAPNLNLGRWATSLGAISYSLYLTHTPVAMRVIIFGHRFGDGVLLECLLIVFSIVVAISFAFVFWRLIEVPSIRASKADRPA